MNYRHAFHAGNFADILKHWILCLSLKRLAQKPAPFRVLDLFAGAGHYDLAGEEAQRSPEWRDGIGRLIGSQAQSLSPGLLAALEPYLGAVARFDALHASHPGDLRIYPGSPALALSLMRASDRLTAIEANPAQAEILRFALAGDRRANILCQDGWNAGPKMVPPPENRGLVLIDPPFEQAGDDRRVVKCTSEIVRNWPMASLIIWYALKDLRAQAQVDAEFRQAGVKDLWRVNFFVGPLHETPGLHACALYLVRPAFGLIELLQTHLAELATILVQSDPDPAHSSRVSRTPLSSCELL